MMVLANDASPTVLFLGYQLPVASSSGYDEVVVCGKSGCFSLGDDDQRSDLGRECICVCIYFFAWFWLVSQRLGFRLPR